MFFIAEISFLITLAKQLHLEPSRGGTDQACPVSPPTSSVRAILSFIPGVK